MTKKSSVVFILLTLAAIIYALTNPFETAYYCSLAVRLCLNSLIPSLFIFMVLARILARFCAKGIFKNKFTSLLSRALHLPEHLIPICIFGLVSGAPSGAFAIADIYKKGLCTKDEAERACVLSNNCSAAFILGFAGGQFSNRYIGLFILFANILSTLTIYLILFNDKSSSSRRSLEKHDTSIGFTDIITSSITDTTIAIVNLCGFVIFFYTLAGIICENAVHFTGLSLFSANSHALTKTIISGILEMTSGVLCSTTIDGNLSIIMTSSICAFCGISVIMQVRNILKNHGLSARSFILARVLCALLCPIYTVILILLSAHYITVSKIHASHQEGIAPGDVLSLCFITAVAIIGAILLSYLDKKHKNK